MKTTFETDNETFPADAYQVSGYSGIAWWVLGWETRPDTFEDGEETGYYTRTGRVVAVMVGDDRKFFFHEDDCTPLAREEFCGGCGQIGCGHG